MSTKKILFYLLLIFLFALPIVAGLIQRGVI